jgi:hypothetical protein
MPPTIFNKRGTALALSSNNPILGSGELCVETDTRKIKFGDGVTPWNNLQYAILPNSGVIINHPAISGGSANFNSLSVSGVLVSVSGHSHLSSNITDFNESVDDRVSSLLVSGTGISLSYNDNNNTLIVATSGVSLEGHTHDILELGNFTNIILDAYEVIDTNNVQNESILYGIGRDRYIYQINPVGLRYYPVYNTELTGNVNGLAYDANQNTLFFIENLNNLNTLYYLRNNTTFGSVAQLSVLDPQITNVTGAAYYNSAIWFFINDTNILVKVNITYTSNIPSVASIVKYTIANTPSPNRFGDIAVNSSGIMYAATSSPSTGVLYTLNLNSDPSNTLTTIGSIPSQGLQISFDLTNNILYGYRNLNKQFYTISTNDASLTSIPLVADVDFTDLAGPTNIIYEPESVKFYQRRGYKDILQTLNPVLGEGELCLEIDTNRIKFGDGSTAWNSLEYAIISNSGTIINYPVISGANIVDSSGNFDSLSINNVSVSTSGHSHLSSDITDFGSGVSGLLSVTNILGGTNISVVPSGTSYTISVSGSLGLTTEEVDDRVSDLLIGGSGISLTYDDNLNTLTINNTSISPDEIEEYSTTSNFPASGDANILYIANNTAQMFKWDGEVYYEAGPQGADTGSHSIKHMSDNIDPIPLTEYNVPQFTSNTNNLNHLNKDVLYITADANNRELTGLLAPSFCCVKLLVNTSSTNTIIVDNQSTNSDPANRFLIYTGSDYYLLPGQSLSLLYSTEAMRWRVL